MYRRWVQNVTHPQHFEVAQDLQEEEVPLFLLHLNVMPSCCCCYWDHLDSVVGTDYSTTHSHLVAAEPVSQSDD